MMFRRLQQWCQTFVRRHIACWPDEYFKSCSQPSNFQPAADVGVIRSSVSRFFKYNQEGSLYVLPYEPIYEQAIETMRIDGWQVTLQCSSGGTLFYIISARIKNSTLIPFKSNDMNRYIKTIKISPMMK